MMLMFIRVVGVGMVKRYMKLKLNFHSLLIHLACYWMAYDMILIVFLACFGRVPAHKNLIAWPISRQICYEIPYEYFITLIAAELERCLLQYYVKKMQNLINTHKFLQESLAQQVKCRMDRLPIAPVQGLRFSKEELNFLLPKTKIFIQKQIQLKNMSGYIWNHYNVNKGKYNELLRKIIASVFGQYILEPFEYLEMRIKLIEEEASNYKLMISRALQGQINIQKPQNYKLQEKNQAQVKAISKPFIPLRETLKQVYQSQNAEQEWNTIDNKERIFIVNRSLK